MRLSAAVKMCGDFDKPNKDRKKFVWPMLEKFPEANYCTPSGMYLLGRNCREAEVYEQYNLRYDIEKSRVVFPISINGDLCGAQGRYVYDSDKVLKYWNYWNFERAKVIGGYDQAKESENTGIIVVEGFFDMLPHIKTAEELGYNMVCTFGAMMTQEQANLIISLDKSVLICYDMDLAGEKGWKSCNRLHKRVPSLRRIKCRKDEDAGDMTKESFREMVQSSFKKGKYYV